MPDLPTPDRPFDKLGKYELRGVLGKGAMGVVYDGWDPMIERRVAIKTARLPDPDDVEAQEEMGRFRREAQAAGRLSHPNIVGVYDSGEEGGVAYFVMELVEGQSLKEMLARDQRFTPADAVAVMEEVLAGLNYSHGRGVIHRDIKPANVMVTHAGQAKIADFGIARIESSSMTQAGTMMGTPAYMSPEQFMGQTVDSRTDIYSAGVMLYQILTGERPFEGTITAIMHKALNTTPPKPSELSVTVKPALDAVVARAMARRPEDRFSTAAEFAAALRAAYEAPDALPPAAAPDEDATMVSPSIRTAAPRPAPTAPLAAGEPRKRSNMPLIAAGVAAVLLLGGGGAWVALSGSKPAPHVVPPRQKPDAPEPVQLPDPIPSEPSQTPPGDGPRTDGPRAGGDPPRELPPLRTPETQTATAAPITPPQPARPDPAIVRASVANALRHAPCSLTETSAEGDGLTVRGIAGSLEADTLRKMAAPAAEGLPLKMQVSHIDTRYCRVVNLVRDAGTSPAMSLTLLNGVNQLHDKDKIVPVLTMPSTPMYLRLDYLSSDGSVYHIFPNDKDKDRIYPPGAAWQPQPGGGFAAAAPFGMDMIVAVASSTPLFPGVRKDFEGADAYLSALQAAIEAARQRGGAVTARALPLDILP